MKTFHKDSVRDFKSVNKLLEYMRSEAEPDSSKCMMIIKQFVDKTIEVLLWNIHRLPGWEDDLRQFVYLYFLESVFGKGNINLDYSAEEVYCYVIRCIEGLLRNFRRSLRSTEVQLDEDLFSWIDRKSLWHNFEFDLDREVVERQIDSRVRDYLSVRQKVDRGVVGRMLGIERWREYSEVG